MCTKTFHKRYSSPRELIPLLRTRGLAIDDEAKAEQYLTTISYYRLSAYMYPFIDFPKTEHKYKPDSSFSKVMMLYLFDKKLRLLIFNEIEKIEIAVRSTIVNVGCKITRDSFWMTNPSFFADKNKFDKTMALIDLELHRSKEDFITHFYETYSNPYPPAWILAEILPFGVVTNIYSNIKDNKIKKQVSKTFDLQIAPFQSWLTIVSLTRNNCCHHSRIWNRQFTLMPMIPNKMNKRWITLKTDKLRIYFNLCIIKYFVDVISANNRMTEKLKGLLKE